MAVVVGNGRPGRRLGMDGVVVMSWLLSRRRLVWLFGFAASIKVLHLTSEGSKYTRSREGRPTLSAADAAVDKHLSAADAAVDKHLEQIRLLASSNATTLQCQHVVDESKAYDEGKCGRMLSAYRASGRKLKNCDAVAGRYSHPFGWECRLKQSLYDIVEEASLSKCSFGFMDVGSCDGDWVVAMASVFPESRHAAIEAHPKTHVTMYRGFGANGLHDRVLSYPFAVGDVNSSGIRVEADAVSWLVPNEVHVHGWEPSICLNPKAAADGRFKAQGGSASNCDSKDPSIPIASIDLVLRNWQRGGSGSTGTQVTRRLARGGLFAVKIDVEGAERDALRGARSGFSDEKQRPCVIYVELKRAQIYEEAFELLFSDLGYTEVVDLDSGRKGRESFPPVGKMYRNEGNYEFRLPQAGNEACVRRVRQATCGLT